jgi:hypothetical protein
MQASGIVWRSTPPYWLRNQPERGVNLLLGLWCEEGNWLPVRQVLKCTGHWFPSYLGVDKPIDSLTDAHDWLMLRSELLAAFPWLGWE